MLNPLSSLAKLLDAPVRSGHVTWIGLRAARRALMTVVETAQLEARWGLTGDRYSRVDGDRQVTLIEAESLISIASYLGMAEIAPALVRRNIVTRGINLLALKGRQFRIGDALLETTGECHPCSRMEEVLGVGGYNAVRGLGGITARVMVSGAIRLGDPIVRADLPATS